MSNKMRRGICVVVVAALFVTVGVVLKVFSEKIPGTGHIFDGKHENKVEKEVKPDKKITLGDAPEGYYEDALFIGDSRTVGLHSFAPIEGATYFDSVGLNVYKVEDTTVEIEGLGEVTLAELLNSRTFGKIYVMLGINELGFDYDTTLSNYKGLIDTIRSLQPDSIIFIQANLHVGPDKSNSDTVVNNTNINKFNEAISKFANDIDTVYIDANPVFDDENGNLKAECTGDGVHLYANFYEDWVEWLNTKAALKEEAKSE